MTLPSWALLPSLLPSWALLVLLALQCREIDADMTIFNTGVNAAGAKLAVNVADPHWAVFWSSPSQFTGSVSPAAWVPARTATPWALVSGSLPQSMALVGPGTPIAGYVLYRQFFSASLPIAYITVTWVADDTASLFLNGFLVLTDACSFKPGCVNMGSVCCYNKVRSFVVTATAAVLGPNELWLVVPNAGNVGGVWAQFVVTFAPVGGSSTGHIASTGMGANGLALAAGASDPRWRVYCCTATPSVAVNPALFVPAMVGAFAGVSGGSFAAALVGPSDAYAGRCIYATSFNVSAPATTTIGVRWSGNDYADLYVNGALVVDDAASCDGSLACVSSCCWNTWRTAAITGAPLQVGTNTLWFAVPNAAGGARA